MKGEVVVKSAVVQRSRWRQEKTSKEVSVDGRQWKLTETENAVHSRAQWILMCPLTNSFGGREHGSWRREESGFISQCRHPFIVSNSDNLMIAVYGRVMTS